MRSRTLASAAILTAVVALAPPPGHAAGPPEGVSLTGHWKLDRDRSDDPKQKTREALEGMRGGDHDPGAGGSPTGPGIDVMTPGDPRTTPPTPAGGGQPGTPPYGGGSGSPTGRGPSPYGRGQDSRAAVFPKIDQPDELTIAQRRTLVLIQEGDDEGSVRGIHTDGQRRPMPGGGGEVSGAWEDGRLVVETRRDDGVRYTETYQLSADGGELTVAVHIMAPRMTSLTIESVYLITPSPVN
jgi:hypothetical protein